MKKLLKKEVVVAEENPMLGRTFKLSNNTATIEQLIAEGGFGVVFLAKVNTQNFALKRIVVNNQDDLDVALEEVNIMKTIAKESNYLLESVDSIVTLLSPGVHEILCLSAFCKTTLLSLLKKLNEDNIVEVLMQVLLGVQHLHKHSVIHRDLKVENILHNGSNYVICDFGSCTTVIHDPSKANVKLIQEELEKYTTLAYRSPEMVDLYSDRGVIGVKSDVWALGVLLYKLCYSTTPFGDSILAITSSRFEIPQNPLYSRELTLFISYLLQPDQTSRPDVAMAIEYLVSKNSNTLDVDKISQLINSKSCTEQVKINKVALNATTTSVTPRQRPKPNTTVTVPIVDRQPSPLPNPQPPQPHWNPFEDAVQSSPTNVPLDDEIFANAPFEYRGTRNNGITNFSFNDE